MFFNKIKKKRIEPIFKKGEDAWTVVSTYGPAKVRIKDVTLGETTSNDVYKITFVSPSVYNDTETRAYHLFKDYQSASEAASDSLLSISINNLQNSFCCKENANVLLASSDKYYAEGISCLEKLISRKLATEEVDKVSSIFNNSSLSTSEAKEKIKNLFSI